ncbi:hypothetical protein PQE68_gp083 [Bacillus phage vB_BanS_Sophrita]|uniref:Uncharacterized protein n=1 Tax=Bacillus phage vB_BanS_Sophrita TaxID=2894790 RepID=A0AAE8YX62_9CAUD|nr:hypothetical protein PQE68_gp083 [Bacillus phage vB_BanS_Sophrita]UGO50674.1 hypothetical protein SOPHRITA_83 [Bacillus phage vB_BanS_Sophrita]
MDMWCDFCGDKPKGATVRVNGKTYEVCTHCERLTVQDKDK